MGAETCCTMYTVRVTDVTVRDQATQLQTTHSVRETSMSPDRGERVTAARPRVWRRVDCGEWTAARALRREHCATAARALMREAEDCSESTAVRGLRREDCGESWGKPEFLAGHYLISGNHFSHLATLFLGNFLEIFKFLLPVHPGREVAEVQFSQCSVPSTDMHDATVSPTVPHSPQTPILGRGCCCAT